MRFIAVLIICSFTLAACTKSRSAPGKQQPGAPAPKATAPGAKAAPTAAPGALAPPPGAPAGPAPTAAPPGTPPPGSAPPPAPGTAGKAGPGEKGGPPLKQPKISKKDGAVFSTYTAGVTEIIAGDSAVKDAAAVKAIVAALNPGQNVAGNRKPCEFIYQIAFKNGAGKDLGGVGICGPAGTNTLAIFGDNKTGIEWQLTIPNSKALGGLLDKHLPAAKAK